MPEAAAALSVFLSPRPLSCLPAAPALGLLPFHRRSPAGAGRQQEHRRQGDDRPHAQEGQRNAWGLGRPVVCLHIKTGQHQGRGEGVGREQEPALEEQHAVPQEKGQDGAAQIGPPHLAEYQNHGHTDQEGGQRRGHHLSALLEDHPQRQSGKPCQRPREHRHSHAVKAKQQGQQAGDCQFAR